MPLMFTKLWPLLVGLLMAAVVLAAVPAQAAEPRDPEQYFFNPNTGDLKAEVGDARTAGKKAIFIMFEQEGCPGCLYMKRNVLNRLDVQKFYREKFLNFSVDIFGAVSIRDFTGRDFTEKSYAQSLHVTATPTIAFYDLDGNEVARIVGPVRDGAEFLLLGEFIASGAYKTSKFAEYKRSQQKKKGS